MPGLVLGVQVILIGAQKVKNAFPGSRLMLVGSGRPACAFLCVKYFFLKGSIVVLHCGLLCDKLLRYLL